MEQDIQKLIEANLPAQVGKVLQERLAKADADAKKIVDLNDLVDREKKTRLDFENRLNEALKLNNTAADLVVRKQTLDKRENEIAVKELTYQLISEKDKTKFAQDVALGLVRNIEYRKSAFDNQNVPLMDQYGSTRFENKSTNSNETNTAE